MTSKLFPLSLTRTSKLFPLSLTWTSRLAPAALIWLAVGCGPTVTVTETPSQGSSEVPMFPAGQVEHSAFVEPPIDPAALAELDHPLPIRVTTTVGQITDIVESIGEDNVVVDQIVPGEDDPHLYVPTPDDVASLSGADVIFYNGLFLEGQMGEILESMERQGIVVTAVTAGFESSQLLEREYSPGQFVTDPHVWFDTELWSAAAANATTVLAALDPSNAALYRERLTTYQEKLADVRAWARATIATIPESHRIMVTSHDAFQYFGRSLDLQVRGLQGLSTEVEAGTRDVLELAEFIAGNEIPAVFVEASVSPEALQAVVSAVRSEGGDVRIGGELFSDTPGRRGTSEGSYPGMVLWNVATVAHSLGGSVDSGNLPQSLTDAEWDYAALTTSAVADADEAAQHAP